MDLLKFIALDGEDLEVVSTHLQDAVVRSSEVLWRPEEHRLVVALEVQDAGGADDPSQGAAGGEGDRLGRGEVKDRQHTRANAKHCSRSDRCR